MLSEGAPCGREDEGGGWLSAFLELGEMPWRASDLRTASTREDIVEVVGMGGIAVD